MLSIKKILYFALVLCAFYSCDDPAPCSGWSPIDPNFKCQPVTGTFTDTRDGTVYETVTICNQTWMAEHLTYDTPDTLEFVLSDSMGNTATIPGYDTILEGKHRYNYASAQYACPSGWHLPSGDEWNILEINLGMNPQDTIDYPFFNRACGLAPIFMSTTGWKGAGTNTSKFNLPGPYIDALWVAGAFYDFHYDTEFNQLHISPSYRRYDWDSLRIRHSPMNNIVEFYKSSCCIRCIKD